MKQQILTVLENERIAKNTYKMLLAGEVKTRPGQFINIKLDGKFLRRPISVCDFSENTLTIIYKVVGAGTEMMSRMSTGKQLDVLTGLGNGYNTEASGDAPLLIGGGAGVPPMFALAKELIGKGKQPTVILGFNSADEVFFEEEFKALGASVFVATADGSRGAKGFVTDVMRDLDYSTFFACGPEPMLRAINDVAKTDGQMSFEERMGCGFGACMGCTCRTKTGNKRICREGPVLLRSEVIW